MGCLADFLKNILFFYDVHPNFNNDVKYKKLLIYYQQLSFY